MTIEYEFKCPQCGHDYFYEEVTNVIQRHIASKVSVPSEGDTGWSIIDFEDTETDDSHTEASFFCCDSCGYEIPDITCEGEMIEWIKKNGVKL